MDRGDGDFLRRDQDPDHGMKLSQHVLDLVGSVRAHVDARRKRSALSVENDHGDIMVRLDLRQRMRQLLHHGDVDDIQGRMAQHNASNWRCDIDCETGVRCLCGRHMLSSSTFTLSG